MNNEKVINPKSTYLAVYSEFESNLIQLEEQVKDAVVDLTTKQGLKDCKEAATKFQKVRTGVEKARKEETKEQREYINSVNEDAKKITERILPLENKFKQPLDERKAAFKDRIAEIDAMPSIHEHSSSEVIGLALGELESVNPADFAEFKKDCEASLYTANDKLSSLLSLAVEREETERKAEAERIRMEEEAKQQAELIAAQQKREEIQSRITKLQQIPLELMGKPSVDIKAKLDALSSYEPSVEDFGDRLTEVQGMMSVTVSQLEMMHAQSLQLEEMQAQQDTQPEKAENSESGVSIQTLAETEPRHYSNQLSEEDAPLYTDCIADSEPVNVVKEAISEVCEETQQEKSAAILCELMQGELSLPQAVEIVGLIDAGLIHNLSFNA